MQQELATMMLLAVLLGAVQTSAGGTPPQSEAVDESVPDKEDADKTTTSTRPEKTVAEILVTALRSESQWLDTPNTVQTVTAADIRLRKMSSTMPEALREMPGIMLQKTSNGQGSPFIRGFTGFRNLLLIDGVRFNNSIFRDGPNQYWNTVDPLTLDRLEVVKGPSSVLYGSDAIGGTVNAITRDPDFFDQRKGQTRLYYRYATAENSHAVRAEYSGRVEDGVRVLLGSSYRNFGNVRGGREVGSQSKTGYSELTGDVKLIYDLDPNHRLTLYHQSFDQNDLWRTHKTTRGISWKGTTVGNEVKRVLDQYRSLTYLEYRAENLGSLIDAMTVNVSYQTHKERQSRVRGNLRRDQQAIDVGTLGAMFQLESPSPAGRWTYGAEYYLDRVDSWRKDYNADGTPRAENIQGPVGDDARYGQLGLFVQDDIPIGDRVDLILGGRYTHVRARADRVEDPATGNAFNIKKNWDSVVGSARVLARLDGEDHWTAFGGISQGFRAPNLSDLSRLDTARTNEIETPSPDLDPEKYLQYEIGLKSQYDRFSGQASFFVTDIRNMIVRTPTGAVIGGDNEVTKQNAGDGWMHGVELEGSWRFHPAWTVFGGFTYVDGEVDTFPTAGQTKRREPIDRLMPPTGTLGLRWDSPGRTFWVEAVGTFAAKADNLSTRDQADTQRIPPGGTPGYRVLTLRGGWNVNRNLSVFAALENVTNEDYRIHGSGVNEPGANLIVGMDWTF